MMEDLEKTINQPDFIGKTFKSGDKEYTIKCADNYEYWDPIDKSITKKQVGIPVNIMECEYFIFTFGLAHS